MLTDNLKILLASTNALAIKAQNFHWNVEGADFPQYHSFYLPGFFTTITACLTAHQVANDGSGTSNQT